MRQNNLNIPLFEDINHEQKIINKRYYFFKKVNRSIVPEEDVNINEIAKNKLKDIKKSVKKNSIPSRFSKNWKDVSLYHPTGEREEMSSSFYYFLTN
jgi:hypothetical protein